LGGYFWGGSTAAGGEEEGGDENQDEKFFEVLHKRVFFLVVKESGRGQLNVGIVADYGSFVKANWVQKKPFGSAERLGFYLLRR